MTDPLARLAAALADRYHIERKLGEGGMATVHLAEDLKHHRQVAIKVLKQELTAVVGSERFLAEIRTTANLQHPGILPLHDSGEADSFLYYVMPYVEGESLRERLDREHQLPVEEAVKIAGDVAEALDYAHRHGVVHRDVKPGNILLVAGRPVISDFGIALAIGAAGGGRLTETGLSLGTPHYMSPEQATGDAHVGPATDVYALGCVLYEMLTGDPPHVGGTAQAVLGKIITEPPPSVTQQRKSVPANVDAAIRKALEKLPVDRFRSVGELAKALDDPGFRHGVTASVTNVRALGWWIRSPWSWGMTALAAIVVAVLVARRPPPAADTLPPFQFILATTDSVSPVVGVWPGAISPDGGTVVFPAAGPDGQRMLYSLRTNELQAHPIPGTAGANQPYFSPDGTWLGFEQNGEERKVRLDGSSPVTITGGGVTNNGAAWTPGGQIVIGYFGAFKGLARVSAGGGKAVALTHVDTTKGEKHHMWPIATPDPNVVVFTIWYGGLASSKLAAASLPNSQITPLGISGIRPLAVLDGHLVYVQADGSVMAVPFDVQHERVTGTPVPVHDRVGVNRKVDNSEIYVSTGGALLTGEASSSGRLVWKSSDGTLRPAAPGARAYDWVAPSPDGKRIAAVVSDDQGSDLWIWDAALSTFSRLTTLGTLGSVSWSRDGADVVYVAQDSAQYAVWSQPVSGGSPPRKLFALPTPIPSATLSPNGTSLVVMAFRGSGSDLLRVALDSTPKVARPYVANGFSNMVPRFSPDGKWVAYESDRTGQLEVYVSSFPDPSRKIQVSTGGGIDPLWSADGSRLYYVSSAGGDTVLLGARVSLSPTFRLLGRDRVASLAGLTVEYYGAAPIGNRVLAVEPVSGGYRLVVSPNWGTELRKRLAASGGDGRQ